MYFEIDIFTNS